VCQHRRVLAFAAPPQPVAAAGHRTVLTGRVSAATGRFAGGHAQARIVLSDAGPHRFSAVIATSACAGLHGCPGGTVRGTWRALASNPDTGQAVALAGGGNLRVLGAVRASGRGHGTGFVARARPTLRLVLSSASGSITIAATGPLERGFTPLL
jgi:hypothetical protein